MHDSSQRALPATLGGGRYVVERLLGEGSRKRVYLAHDVQLDRDVAIGMVKTEHLDETGLARLRAEARAMGRLGDHPHIVTVFDIGEENGRPYVVSQYMPGGSVEDLLHATDDGRESRVESAGVCSGGAIPIPQSVRIADQICQALEHAHGHGIIHRDLKPANVWLTADAVAKLGDFGLAVSLNRTRFTVDSSIVGTVAYLAPEQALGKPADARSDLYALGAMLYEMVTGHLPFLGDDAVSVIHQHLHVPPVAPAVHNPQISPTLEALILQLLAKAPEDRPQSAAAVRVALAAASAPPLTDAPAQLNPLDRLAAGIFVGREAEMKLLRAGVEAAIGGCGQVFLVSGEAGIGKTRLAAELGTYARIRGARVLWGRCYAGEGTPAFWPWAQITRRYVEQCDAAQLRQHIGSGAAAIAQVVAEVAEMLPDLPALPALEPEAARFRFFDGVTTFLRAAATQQPLFVVLEDLHDADRASLLLLQFLAREISQARLVVVSTYRDMTLEPTHPLRDAIAELVREPVSQQLALRGLSAKDVERFIESTAALRPPQSLVAMVHDKTDGNPLFVTEVVRLLATSGELTRPHATHGRDATVPPGVREVMRQRLAQLSTACREMLSVAAVIGREFDLELLHTASATATPDVLEEATGARIIAALPGPAERFRFSHALMRDVIYGELSAKRRIEAHRTVAVAIEQRRAHNVEVYFAQLAHHFFEVARGQSTDSGDARKAVEYAERAGDQALRALSYEAAAEQYRRALQALELSGSPDPRHRCELLLSLADAQMRSGEGEASQRTTKDAAALARQRGLVEYFARAALGFGWRFDVGVVDTERIALLEEALQLINPGDSALRARLLARLSLVLHWSLEMRSRRIALTREAVSMARRLNDSATLAFTLNANLFALWDPAHSDTRRDTARELLQLAEPSGEIELALQSRHWLVASLLELGEIEAAYREIATHAEQATELRQPLYLWFAATWKAMQALLEGRFAECEHFAQEALEFGLRTEPQNAERNYSTLLFGLRREQGRLEEVLPAFEAWAAAEPHLLTAAYRCGLAFIYSEVGRTTAAREEFEMVAANDFRDIPWDISWVTALGYVAEVCTRLADRARAATLYDLLLPWAGRIDLIGLAIACTGSVSLRLGLLAALLERWDDAARHFDEALAMHLKMGARPLVARTQYGYADMLARRGHPNDQERALALLAQARATATELGMPALVQRIDPLHHQLTQAAASIPVTQWSKDPLSTQRLRALELGRACAERLELDDLIAFVAGECRAALDAEGAAVLLLDAQRHEFYFPSAAEDDAAVAARLRHLRFPAGLGIAGAALRERQALRVDDVGRDPRFFGGIDQTTGRTTRTLLAAPLLSRRGAIGVIEVVNRHGGGPFTDNDLAFLETLSSSVAAAIDNARRYALLKTSEERLQVQVAALRRDLARRDQFTEIVGTSAVMSEVFRLMESAAASPIAVLIEGETGTGKELVARGIHRTSSRADGPFIAVNCAALPEALLESELFGHRKGAFTGAAADRVGLFEAADGGTIFLDEIGEMPTAMQARLLRVLQEGEVVPVGDTRPRTIDVRVISATNRDLTAEVERGAFRRDLYYRLAAFPIHLPPLRTRGDDVALLVDRFLSIAGERHRKRIAGVEPEALAALTRFGWPGNVRELQNEVDRAVAIARDGSTIGTAHLSAKLAAVPTPPQTDEVMVRDAHPPHPGSADPHPFSPFHNPQSAFSGSLRQARATFEAHYITDVLQRHGGNITRTAKELGLSRPVLHQKIKQYGIK
ncbi:MAG TPA: sigma 54-interacting transcriptional regulator [Candidatus Margulisiibacteriota bacterium]|nr:sigma 54-interacting transcriptional regulator [Candidatus Margulisiibacteriota bacterium]